MMPMLAEGGGDGFPWLDTMGSAASIIGLLVSAAIVWQVGKMRRVFSFRGRGKRILDDLAKDATNLMSLISAESVPAQETAVLLGRSTARLSALASTLPNPASREVQKAAKTIRRRGSGCRCYARYLWRKVWAEKDITVEEAWYCYSKLWEIHGALSERLENEVWNSNG